MKIKTQILCLVSGAVVSLGMLTFFGWLSLHQAAQGLDQIVEEQFLSLINDDIGPLIDEDMLPLITHDLSEINQMQASLEGILEADRDIRQAVIAEKACLVATDNQQFDQNRQLHLRSINHAYDKMMQVAEGFQSSDAQGLYADFQQAFEQWRQRSLEVIDKASDPSRLAFARKASDVGSAYQAFATISSLIDQLTEIHQRDVNSQIKAIQGRRDRIVAQKHRMEQNKEDVTQMAADIQQYTSMFSLLFQVIAVVTALGMAVWGGILARAILRPLSATIEQIREIAAGDLTNLLPVEGSNEISELAIHFNDMVANLNDTLVQIQEVMHQISTSSKKIEHISQTQASSVRMQSAAVTETTAAATELSKSSEQIGASIKSISETAGHISQGMERVKMTTDQTSQILTSLNQKSEQIGNITKLINDIADQTNLLAVNASIEAARAGEQGRGFTVVADQIGKLADSTGRSTKDIASLVELIRHEMNNAIVAMEESLVGVNHEIELATDSTARSREISSNAVQQVSGSRQIAKAMNDIDESMRQITEGALQSADEAGKMSVLFEGLRSFVQKFKTQKSMPMASDES